MCKEIKEKFTELYTLDVNQYVEKKQGLSYLSWGFAWKEFKKVYPEATYEVRKDENGRCYFGDADIGYMVYTSVSAGGLTYEMWLPVMDNANKSMKLKPYEYNTRQGKKSVEAISMFDVNKAVMRCLVKNLAMFGLGLYIYTGEDLPEDIKEYTCEDCGKPFEPFTDKHGRKFTTAQVYAGAQRANHDGKARCKTCRLKKEEESKSADAEEMED